MANNLIEISKYPTVHERVHESIFRSYHILNKVKEMISRGDSQQTISEAIELMESSDSNIENGQAN